MEPSLARYGPDLLALLRPARLMPLGPGQPVAARRAALETFHWPGPVVDGEMASACLAGLWLYYDFLDESHRLSQEIGSPSGSYWHALMHRREPDPDNSKYWWRRVGHHPVLKQLSEQAPALGYRFTDPYAYVDFVERVRDSGSSDEELARRVQLLEWELLFEHCYRAALSSTTR